MKEYIPTRQWCLDFVARAMPGWGNVAQRENFALTLRMFGHASGLSTEEGWVRFMGEQTRAKLDPDAMDCHLPPQEVYPGDRAAQDAADDRERDHVQKEMARLMDLPEHSAEVRGAVWALMSYWYLWVDRDNEALRDLVVLYVGAFRDGRGIGVAAQPEFKPNK